MAPAFCSGAVSAACLGRLCCKPEIPLLKTIPYIVLSLVP